MSLKNPGCSEDKGGTCSTGSLPRPRAEERVARERWSPNFPAEYPLEQTQHYACLLYTSDAADDTPC
eukprot:2182059-Pyramimonas_sp.AAC.1